MVGLFLLVIGAALQNLALIIVGVVLFGPAVLGDLYILIRFGPFKRRTLAGRTARNYRLEGQDPEQEASSPDLGPNATRSGVILQNITTHGQANMSGKRRQSDFNRENSSLQRLPPAQVLTLEMDDKGGMIHRFADVDQDWKSPELEGETSLSSPISNSVEDTRLATLQPLAGAELLTVASLHAMSGDESDLSNERSRRTSPLQSAGQSKSSTPVSEPKAGGRETGYASGSRLVPLGSRQSSFDQNMPSSQLISAAHGIEPKSTQSSDSERRSSSDKDNQNPSSTSSTYTFNRLFNQDGWGPRGSVDHSVDEEEEEEDAF